MSTINYPPPPFPPYPPPPYSAPEPAPVSPPKRKRWPWVTAAVVAVIVGLIWVAPASTFTMEGTGTLAQMAGMRVGESDTCTGNFFHPSIKGGAKVIVYDETGTVIGHSVLRSGTVTASLTCELPFTVTDLPTGKKAYSVEVAGTGEISFTEEEAKHNPGVTWGY